MSKVVKGRVKGAEAFISASAPFLSSPYTAHPWGVLKRPIAGVATAIAGVATAIAEVERPL
ncbi:MAG: hypothetical protein LBK25_05610 [Treponema sp.]|nr:hypothetical protein [Treponema sp.]